MLPEKLHITIPKNSRFQHRAIPARIIVDHANLSVGEITTYEGVPVTTIERTIQDVINKGQTDFAAQAIRDASRQGHIDRNAAARLTNYLKRQRKKSNA